MSEGLKFQNPAEVLAAYEGDFGGEAQTAAEWLFDNNVEMLSFGQQGVWGPRFQQAVNDHLEASGEELVYEDDDDDQEAGAEQQPPVELGDLADFAARDAARKQL